MINPLNELSGVYLEHIAEQHPEPVHSYRKEENEVVDEYIDTVKKVKKAELDQDIERWKENVNEASYPGYDEKGKKKDDRLTVTHADRKGNTPAYQRYKAGDKRYKAADHLKKESYETKKTSEVLGALKKKKASFKKRYGKMAPDVMLDVAKKTVKRKGDTSKSDDRYAYEEVVHEGKCDDCTCEGCGPDGVGHQDPCVECGGHHKEMKEGFSNWREDLREIADDIPETEKKMEVKIKEKNVKNKIVINPVLGEEIKKIGGELLEMSEVEEQVAAGGAVPLSTQEIMIAKRQAMLNTRASKARQRTISKVKAEKKLKEEQGLDKYDRHKRMIRHKQDKYGRNVVGADYNLENERKAKGWKKKLNKEDFVDEAAKDQSSKQLDRGMKTTQKAMGVIDNSPYGKLSDDKVDRMNKRLRDRRKDISGEKTSKLTKLLKKEDKAFDNVVGMLRKKHGESGVLTKDSPKSKAQPQPKKKPEKDTRSSAQREVDAQYGRTPWNKKGSLGT